MIAKDSGGLVGVGGKLRYDWIYISPDSPDSYRFRFQISMYSAVDSDFLIYKKNYCCRWALTLIQKKINLLTLYIYIYIRIRDLKLNQSA